MTTKITGRTLQTVFRFGWPPWHTVLRDVNDSIYVGMDDDNMSGISRAYYLKPHNDFGKINESSIELTNLRDGVNAHRGKEVVLFVDESTEPALQNPLQAGVGHKITARLKDAQQGAYLSAEWSPPNSERR